MVWLETEKQFDEEDNISNYIISLCIIYIQLEKELNNNDTSITCSFDTQGSFFQCLDKIKNPLATLYIVEI
jgi:hypothetical protein